VTTEPHVLLDVTNSIGTVTLNRPDRLNAFFGSMRDEIAEALEELAAREDVRVVVVTGRGRAFCSGADVGYMADLLERGAYDEANLLVTAGRRVIRSIIEMPKPVIAALNGLTIGGGFELALMGDILLASTDARFADTHCRVGLAPGWGLSQKLARIVGPSRAREAHFTGNFISAEQAADWGLVSRVVAGDDLLDECRKLATDIAGCVPETVKVYKQMVNDGLGMDLAAGLAMERSVMSHANRGISGDTIAGRRSAVQQRGKAQKGS